MRKADLLKLKKILSKIKEPDSFVQECIAIVDKDIAIFESRKGQIKEGYDYENSPY